MLNITFHSTIDLITNSSSVVYITASRSAPDILHNMIDGILAVTGSTLKSRDLFDISVALDTDTLVDKLYYDYDPDDGIEYNPIASEFAARVGTEEVETLLTRLQASDWNGRPELIREFLDKHAAALADINYESLFDNGTVNTSLSVVAKDENLKESAGILSRLESLFNHEASYDG